eukprot:625202-Hanusia_phi.AAC.1
MIEVDPHTGLPVAHVHARIRLPHVTSRLQRWHALTLGRRQVLGVFRTPWKELLRASTEDDVGPSLCGNARKKPASWDSQGDADATQVVRFMPSVDEETGEFCFVVFFMRRADM